MGVRVWDEACVGVGVSLSQPRESVTATTTTTSTHHLLLQLSSSLTAARGVSGDRNRFHLMFPAITVTHPRVQQKKSLKNCQPKKHRVTDAHLPLSLLVRGVRDAA